MNDIILFRNPHFGDIRVVSIDDEPWFIGKDVAEALGYGAGKSLANAVANHVDPEDKGVTEMMTPGGIQKMTIINESGLYSLILSSKLPEAKKFKRWVTSEVLPSLRQSGGYVMGQEAMTDEELMAQALLAAKRTIQNRESRILELEAKTEVQQQAIEDMEPRMQYLDKILESPGTLTITQIAADYGMSARQLNEILHKQHIQRCVNGQWVLYREHMGQGYTKSNTVNITRSDGRPDTKITTRWTQKGRLLIHNTLAKCGIVAQMDREVKDGQA